MSTTTVTYIGTLRVQRAAVIRWTAILIAISLILIVVAILIIVLSTTKDKDVFQADLIPIVKNSVTSFRSPRLPQQTSKPLQLNSLALSL